MIEIKSKKIEDLESKVKDADENFEEITLFDKREKEIVTLKSEISSIKDKIKDFSKREVQLTGQLGVEKANVEKLEKELAKCENLASEKLIYELYLDATGKNGISYWIISKKMPIINNQVNSILAQAVNFKLYIEDDPEDKSVKIFIVDEKGKRSIELGSGMEKTMAAIAIRAALWSVCLLPKTPLLILDESFSHLDAEKYDGIINLLNYVKKYFDAILIITHDEELKGLLDHSYYITKDVKGSSQCRIG